MVEWRPLIGVLPPLNAQDWQHEFDLYQQTPEFQKKNFWMGIDDFKTIYFWEWFHRLWGRMIGLVYALPLFYFLLKRKIPQGYVLPLLFILVLGGLQGFMGWYMVQSGLIDRPSVSHYRLAAHLSLALLIFSLVLWLAMRIGGYKPKPSKALFIHSLVGLLSLIVTITWGAFVAGLDAGLIYNEFPKMGAGLMPKDMWHLQPAWLNLFDHIPAIQFTHRWLGITTALIIGSIAIHAGMKGQNFGGYYLVSVLAFAQAALGIITLLSGVHIVVATLHQALAVLLLATLVMCIFMSRPERQNKNQFSVSEPGIGG